MVRFVVEFAMEEDWCTCDGVAAASVDEVGIDKLAHLD